MIDPPHDFRPAVVLTVLVVLLAGCSGLLGAESQTPTPETTVADFQYPSGWSQEGIADLGSALRTNHETVLNVSHTSRLMIIDADSNRTVVRTIDTAAGTGATRLIDTQLNADLEMYYSDEGVFRFDRTAGELTERADENWTMADVAVHEGFRRVLGTLELNATGTVIVEGEPAVRYSVTGLENPEHVPANTARGQVVVSEAGFIAEFDVTKSNDDFTRQTTYAISEFGTATVERPVWLPDE